MAGTTSTQLQCKVSQSMIDLESIRVVKCFMHLAWLWMKRACTVGCTFY